MKNNLKKKLFCILTAGVLAFSGTAGLFDITANADDNVGSSYEETATNKSGGGYAASGQIDGVGYTTRIFDASTGLPTSDANVIMADSEGYIWIGGYSGVIKYDGRVFERQPAATGMTSAKAFYEDTKGRIFVGTNDNGFIVISGSQTRQYTYEDGLLSSTIRGFGETADGTIIVGSTCGVGYVDDEGRFKNIDDERLNDEYVIRMDTDENGVVYGNTRNGGVFRIEGLEVTGYFTGDDIGTGRITTVYCDPVNPGYIYIGTDESEIYHGTFDDSLKNLKKTDVSPASNINQIYYCCDRLWVICDGIIGYIDENEKYHALENIPFDSGIENMTVDYQGNLWFTSSRQGVLEIVTNNFSDITEMAGLPGEVVNTTCVYKDDLYIGTDKGLFILNKNYETVENELTDYIGETRIRCIKSDSAGNLWICTYTNGLGLICYSEKGVITSFTEDDGMPGNGVRCCVPASDGSILCGTNGGLAVIKNGKIVNTVGEEEGVANTVFLTVEEGFDGKVYAGSDGDGIYVIDGDNVENLGRNAGLTSDVILRIKRDDERGVLWIITSNSIEYLKDGILTVVEKFPYNNNYDIYFDNSGNAWILSSYGIFCVNAEDMIENGDFEYRQYTLADGLHSAPTNNAFSAIADNGDLYVSCRGGVSRFNINNMFEQSGQLILGIAGIYCNDNLLMPGEDGSYIIPHDAGRISIAASVKNYSLSDPVVHIYLEGASDPGITGKLSELGALEYTNLPKGDYRLHIEILDPAGLTPIQDAVFAITKKPSFTELFLVRAGFIVLIMAGAGFLVWRIMSGTIIRRQYDEIRAAKEDAEKANRAKSRFLANMSHEICTPISTIMGLDEMILREDKREIPRDLAKTLNTYARDIMEASENLLGFVYDILDISRIESGETRLVDQPYNIDDMLRTIVKMIRVRAHKADLTFEVHVDENIPRRLFGDMGKIRQIVLNLLTNAVKYTNEGGFKLSVTLLGMNEKTARLRFAVKDTGVGIKQEDMDKIFSAFKRLEEDKNGEVRGTGLGLDISKQFANLMGGELSCESVYGEGSVFMLDVNQKILSPIKVGEFTEEVEEEDVGPYVPSFVAPSADVLVVDDNPMNLSIIKGLLAPTKVFVATAMSGEECLEKIKYGSYHVIFLDYLMPGMDGIETLKHIRETHPDLPVFMLTANAANDEEYYRERGFTGYLAKPVKSADLENAIMKCLPDDIIMKPDKEG